MLDQPLRVVAAGSCLVLLFGASGCDDDCPEMLVHESIALESVPFAPELVFELPVDAVAIPGRPDMFYVAEQGGVIREANLADQTSSVALDLSGRVASFETNWELGLYSVALHPAYPEDGRAYVSFTESDAEGEISSVILEFDVADDGSWRAQSERVVFSVAQPGEVHNGGTLRFLPDGRLGMAFGDGGKEPTTSQDPGTPLGKLVAFDIEAAQTPAPWEILAYGLRNPWKWSVDPESGMVFVGDVGDLDREELNRWEPNSNFGWPRFEGSLEDDGESLCEDCGETREPLTEYCHDVGNSVTSGMIYRGSSIPELRGQFIFGDFSSGQLFLVAPDSEPGAPLVTVGQGGTGITGFIRDHNNDLLVLRRVGGGFQRLQPIDRSLDPAQRLSETGYVDASDPAAPSDAAIPYDLRWPFFSDAAVKRRWVIPGDEVASVTEEGDVELGPGSVLVKLFERGGKPVETRLLIDHGEGRIRGYSYRWRDDGTDAELLDTSLRVETAEGPWYFPSRSECTDCHTAVAGYSLGLTLPQLDLTTSTGAHQHDVLEERGVLPTQRPTVEALPRADDASVDVTVRARAYLDVNCASCHQPGGPGGGVMDLRIDVLESESGLCRQPQVSDLGVPDARIVAAGDLERSVLWKRMVALDTTRMHPFRQTRDPDGEAIVRAWIESAACRP
ncbi:MAG: PQQ-dependent sugar dehydrogenase [Myxococcota bacterium]